MAANVGIKEFFRWDNLWDNPQGQPRDNLKKWDNLKKI